MKIDLRSDTVTRPTPGMLDAMFSAEVGDDVFGEDPTIIQLEEKLAGMFGKTSALFCPSGTMTNQIAMNILSHPYDELVCYKGSHVYLYEGGGMAGNSGLSPKLIDAPRGLLSLDLVRNSINPDDPHFPRTAIISLENTVNKGGGACYDFGEIQRIAEFAREHDVFMHLDGARIFNALICKGENAFDYGACFDTISVCLSKGLGAPVGSVLITDKDRISKARRMRKVFGGGMRQAGYLAAAGIYALNHHIERLQDDHNRARELAGVLSSCGFVGNVLPNETNIVIFELQEDIDAPRFMKKMEEKGLLSVSFGGQLIRFVTHLDFDDAQLDSAVSILRAL